LSTGIYVALVFPLVAGLFFLADLNKYLKILREYRASQNWQNVLGQITASTVEVVEHRTYNNETQTEEIAHLYFPKLEYVFEVHGITQENVRVTFGLEWIDSPVPSKEDADNVIRRYSSGTPVMVYFDPQDPSKAVLERRIVGNYTARLVWKFLLFLAGVCLVLLIAYHK